MASTIERDVRRAELETQQTRRVESSRALAPELTSAEIIEAREYIWLDDVRRGMSSQAIASREGLSRRRIQIGVARARARQKSSHFMDSRKRDTLQNRDGGAQTTVGSASRADDRGESRYPPRLVPLFPIGPFTPQSTSPHRGPIRPGSVFCCMVCSRSGMDGHPALKRDPHTDPRPEPKTVPPTKPAIGRETRKQRRKRLFAAHQPGPAPAGPVLDAESLSSGPFGNSLKNSSC
jgi:hypothetical protein